jgi:hypothetical protein
VCSGTHRRVTSFTCFCLVICSVTLTLRIRQLTRSQEAASAQWYVPRQMLHRTHADEMKAPRDV